MNKVIVVLGPTATGKTKLGVDLALALNGEVISADSRQCYTGLDIGSGKDLNEFSTAKGEVKHHLIDVADPARDEFTLFDFYCGAIQTIKDISERGLQPIIVGGTMLYVDSLIKSYDFQGEKRNMDLRKQWEGKSLAELKALLQEKDPQLYAESDCTQEERVLRALEKAYTETQAEVPKLDCEYLLLAPYYHRKVVQERIQSRLVDRWEGLLTEAQDLWTKGVSHEKLQWFGLEYRFASLFILGEITKEEAFEQLNIKIRQFAKRQDIWARKLEREGGVIHWLKDGDLEKGLDLSRAFLNGEKLPEPELRLMDIDYGEESGKK